MTKEEMLAMLQPFTDELRIVLWDPMRGEFMNIERAMYGMAGDGEGLLILDIGNEARLPPVRRTRKETSSSLGDGVPDDKRDGTAPVNPRKLAR